MGIIDDYDKQYGDNEKPVIDPNAFPDNANIIDSYDNQHGQNFLQVSADQGLKKQPALSQRILKMQAETGLPVDLIERNIDDLEQKSKIAQFDPDKYMKESPTVGKWLAEHPNNFSSAQKDLEKLNYLERQFRFISQQYETGAQTVELSQIGQSAFFGEATKEQRKRQAELEAAMHSKNDYGIEGFWERLPGDLANQAPIMGSMLGGQAKYATIGAGYGAGAALLAGQAGPQVATPEEVVTVPALATAGAVLGWRYGAGIEAGMMEGGLAYLDFEKIKDDEGNLLNQTTARGAALIVGGINGSLEGISFGVLQKTVPGLRNLSRNGVKQLLKSPTSRAAFLRAARTVGEASATEGTTEFMQELVKIAGQELLQMKQDKTLGSASAGDVLNRVFSPENLAAMKESAAVGAKVGGGISTVGATVDAVSDAKEIREAKARGVAYGNIGKIVANTEMAAALPDQTREVLQRMAEEGNTDTAFVPVESWNNYWESQGVDPQKMAFEILGEENVELYTEAVDTGGNIAMPMSNYATLLAPTEHNVFFQREIKPAPDKMNAREAEEQEQQLDELDKQAQEQEAKTDIEFQEIDPTLTKEKLAEQIPSREFASGYNNHLSQRRDALQEEIKTLEDNDLDVPNVLREELQLVKDAKQNLTDAIDEGILTESLKTRDPENQTKIIRDEIEQELINVGRSKTEAKADAQLAADSFRAQAKRFKRSPMDLYNQFKVRLQRREFTGDVGEAFTQKDVSDQILEDISQEAKAEADEAKRVEEFFQSGQQEGKLDLSNAQDFLISRTISTVNQKMGTTATPDQIRGMLKEVKKEELEWLGVEEFLKGQKKVSKTAFMQHLEAMVPSIDVIGEDDIFEGPPEGSIPLEDIDFEFVEYDMSGLPDEIEFRKELLTEESQDDINEWNELLSEIAAFVAEHEITDPSDLLNVNKVDGKFVHVSGEVIPNDLHDEASDLYERRSSMESKADRGQIFLTEEAIEEEAESRARDMLENEEFGAQIFEEKNHDYRIVGNDDSGWFLQDPDGKVLRFYDESFRTFDEANSAFIEFATENQLAHFEEDYEEGQFQDYTVPGGFDYREIKYTVSPNLKGKAMFKIRHRSDPDKHISKTDDEAFQSYAEALEHFEKNNLDINEYAIRSVPTPLPNFTESHFEDYNILAHTRVNDRVINDPKKEGETASVMFMEEGQSDWHKLGHKRGYRSDLTPEKEAEIKKLQFKLRDINDELSGLRNDFEVDRSVISEEENAWNDDRQRMRPPSEIKLADSDRIKDVSTAGYKERRSYRGYFGTSTEVERFVSDANRLQYIIYVNGSSKFRIDDELSEEGRLIKEVEAKLPEIITAEKEKRYGPKRPLTPYNPKVVELLDNATKRMEALEEDYRKKKNSLIEKRNEIANKIPSGDPVPDAPFKNNWYEFLFKQLIRNAIERGNDIISWTDGDTQVQRYRNAVSERVDKIKYSPATETFHGIKGGQNVISKTGVGKKELGDLIGKAAADQIFSASPNEDGYVEIDAEGIDVGGEFLRTLYDTKIPSFLKKFLKKFDSKIEVFEIPITDQGPSGKTKKFFGFRITEKLKDTVTTAGLPLFQGGKGQPKGSFDRANRIINFFQKADQSTFLHEMGHFYLEMFGDLVEQQGAPQEAIDDWNTMLGFMGVESRDQIGVQQHETWARAFEQYLREGKAPSARLRSAFVKFRKWLEKIYQKAIDLQVELSPEIRGVMDRLLATAEDIEAAQVEINQAPLSEDMAAMGFNDKEAVDYATAVNDAKTAAEEEMIQRHMDELKREEQKWWKEEREVVRKEIADEVNNENVYIALSNLQRGKMPDGSELPDGMNKIKLNRDALVKAYGKDFLKTLPKPFIYSAKGGLHQDQAAAYFGFSSGDEMIQAMIQAIPIKDVIEQRTDAIMFERHGDLLLDRETARDIAAEVVHNEKSAQLMVKELKHLASNNFAKFKGLAKKINRPIPTIKEIRAKAERIIANKMVRDIRPIEYQRAEAKAAREAQDLFLKGDFQGAFDAKHRQLMNHELYRAAKNGKVRVDKILNLMAKFNRPTVRQSIGLAGGTYLEQIDAILERFSFKKGVSLKALDKQQSLLDWVRDQEREGLAVDVPESLLNEANRQHYKNTRLAELEQIEETVKSIEHFAKLKNKLLANEAARSVQEVEDEIVGSITAHHKLSEEPPNVAPTLKDRVASRGKSFIAAHTKMEFLFEWLDGAKAGGAVWRHLFMPFVNAENKRNEMMAEVVRNLQDIFGVYTRKERASWMLNPKYYPHINMSLNKNNLMVIALNWGNEYNRTSLMEGYGWNEQQVKVLLAELTEKDWQTVQKVWDYINTFWPAIEKMEKQLNGVAPAKVEASEVETEFGTFEGGYYPIIFDAKLSFRQGAIEEVNNVTEIFGGNWARAMTKKGHTKERTNSGGKPIKLQMTGVIEHINAVVHDLTHREAVIDINKLTSRPRIREAIARTAGREMLSQINPWLMGIANDRQREPSGALAGFFAHARKTATIVNMGFKLTTSLVQFMGYSVSTKELGLKYATKGLKVFANPIAIRKAYKDMAERSPMMRDRLQNYDRDVRDQVTKKSFTGDPRITDAFFASIGYMDMAVSMATWYGAYEKALDGKVENIEAGNEKQAVEFADRTVRVTQGAGASKDLSQIQRGDEYHRMFTMFYSAFNVIFNQFQAATGEVILTKNVPKFVGSMFLLWFFPAVAEDLMLGRGPDEDADEDEWLEWFIHKEVTYPAATVVGVRDMVAMSNGFGYSPSAAFDAIEQPGRTIKTGLQFATGDREDIERKDIKSVFMTAGYLVGLPSRQVWLSSEYFYDWSTGEEEPESVQEGLWRGLVTGKPKE